MFNILLAASFIIGQCPKTRIENHTVSWNTLDKQTLKRAKTRCLHYFPYDPCLKRFIKLEQRRYQAVCGKENPV